MKNRYQNIPEEKKQKLKEYQKEYRNAKAGEYYAQNKDAIKEKTREHYKNLSQEKKTRLKSTKEKGIKNCFNIKRKR